MTTYKETTVQLYDNDLEQASNSYLMATVSIIAGLPLPVVNLIASVGFLLNHTKSSYFVRWHCMQSVIAQTIMIPFNSIAFAWTLKIIFSDHPGQSLFPFFQEQNVNRHYNGFEDIEAIPYYWTYIALVVIFNIAEFITVIITAAEVRKGKNVRWFLVANLTDALTNKANRDPYRI